MSVMYPLGFSGPFPSVVPWSSGVFEVKTEVVVGRTGPCSVNWRVPEQKTEPLSPICETRGEFKDPIPPGALYSVPCHESSQEVFVLRNCSFFFFLSFSVFLLRTYRECGTRRIHWRVCLFARNPSLILYVLKDALSFT